MFTHPHRHKIKYFFKMYLALSLTGCPKASKHQQAVLLGHPWKCGQSSLFGLTCLSYHSLMGKTNYTYEGSVSVGTLIYRLHWSNQPFLDTLFKTIYPMKATVQVFVYWKKEKKSCDPKKLFRGWRTNSVVQSICRSFRRSVFVSQHPHGSSQPSRPPWALYTCGAQTYICQYS